jgi:tripartite-type tricarboxylate transporter receptor subunit TctC
MALSIRVLIGSALAAVACVMSSPAMAQSKYPNRPVKIVVALGPGSATDAFARMLADSLHTDLNGTFIVENKAGAGGVIGTSFVAKSKPDGYTIGVLHSSVLTTAVAITPNLTYDPRKDFTWLGNTVSNPLVLAVPANSQFKTLEDLIAAAKKEPGKYSTGIIGMGTHSHFNLELLKQSSGADLNRVPYSGGTGPVINDLLGQQIDSASLVWSGLSEFVRADKMRVLAATTKLKGFPDIPTFASKGYPQVHLEVFLGVVAPAGLPKDISDILVAAIERAVKNPKNVATMENLGYRIAYERPEKLADTVNKELDVVIPLARKIGITVKE